jgi:hypothetical protein
MAVMQDCALLEEVKVVCIIILNEYANIVSDFRDLLSDELDE